MRAINVTSPLRNPFFFMIHTIKLSKTHEGHHTTLWDLFC